VAERVKNPGEWNTCEIVCKGNAMSVWVNGFLTADWTACDVPQGYFGVDTEGWHMEFRNLKWKQAQKAE
jgi:hypothetical protein